MRSKRAGARRTMLRKIKELRDELDLLRTWWDVPAYIYKPGTSERLPRPAGEYPENDRRYWAATVKRLDVIAGLIEQARQFALIEYNTTIEAAQEQKKEAGGAGA